MQQHNTLRASALLNFRTNIATVHVQRLVEGTVQFTISLKVFSNLITEMCGKSQFSAQNICNSFEIFYPSGVLQTGALYTLTSIAQTKVNIKLVSLNLVSTVRHVLIFVVCCLGIKIIRSARTRSQKYADSFQLEAYGHYNTYRRSDSIRKTLKSVEIVPIHTLTPNKEKM